MNEYDQGWMDGRDSLEDKVEELEAKLKRVTIAKSTLSLMFETTRNEARELEARELGFTQALRELADTIAKREAELERKNDDLEDIMARHIKQKLHIAELEVAVKRWKESTKQWADVCRKLEAENKRWKERTTQEADMCLELGVEIANLKTLVRAVVDAERRDSNVGAYLERAVDALAAALEVK